MTSDGGRLQGGVGEGWDDPSPFDGARVTPLHEVDADLAEYLVARVADRWLAATGLSKSRRPDAVNQTIVQEVVTLDGARHLRVSLPLASGNPTTPWDGSRAQAERIVDFMVERAAEEERWDREHLGPSGWEPETNEA